MLKLINTSTTNGSKRTSQGKFKKISDQQPKVNNTLKARKSKLNPKLAVIRKQGIAINKIENRKTIEINQQNQDVVICKGQ